MEEARRESVATNRESGAAVSSGVKHVIEIAIVILVGIAILVAIRFFGRAGRF
jgi:hypothetical protein